MNITSRYNLNNDDFKQKNKIRSKTSSKLTLETPNIIERKKLSKKKSVLKKLLFDNPNFFNQEENFESPKKIENDFILIKRSENLDKTKVLTNKKKLENQDKIKIEIKNEEIKRLKYLLKKLEIENKKIMKENEKQKNEIMILKEENKKFKYENFNLKDKKLDKSNAKNLNKILDRQINTIKKEYNFINNQLRMEIKLLKEEKKNLLNIFEKNKNYQILEKEIKNYKSLISNLTKENEKFQNLNHNKDFFEIIKKKMDEQKKELIDYDNREINYKNIIKELKKKMTFFSFRLVACLSEIERLRNNPN